MFGRAENQFFPLCVSKAEGIVEQTQPCLRVQYAAYRFVDQRQQGLIGGQRLFQMIGIGFAGHVHVDARAKSKGSGFDRVARRSVGDQFEDRIPVADHQSLITPLLTQQ